MPVTENRHPTERVGQFDLAVVCGDETPQSRACWDRRVEALTAWLLGEWKRQRKEASH